MRRVCTESSRSYLRKSAPRAVQLDDDQTRIGSTGIPRPKRRNVLPACVAKKEAANVIQMSSAICLVMTLARVIAGVDRVRAGDGAACCVVI